MKNIKQKWEVFVGSVNIYVFESYKDSRGYPRERKIAKNVRGEQDANLIASAPEMLEGMKYIKAKLDKYRTLDAEVDYIVRCNILDNIQSIAEDSIAKAEGSTS